MSCGTATAKRDLARIVRTPQGRIVADPTGKMAGRGAYLCADPRCWEQAVKKGRLERTLKTRIAAEELDGLRSFAHNRAQEGK